MLPLKKALEIGDWELDKELGAGGQGTVWKVRYSRDKHSPPGALKICINPDTKARARFEREVSILRSQSDPGIVAVRDAGDYRGSPYFVMELASTSLNRVVVADTAGTRLLRESPALLLALLRQACNALGNLHARGIVHRDIKPSNVLLMLDPPDPMKAVLADLGTAAVEVDQGQLTATHEVVGTPVYRAPETLLGTHTAASDVYAFGKTLEFIFAGGLPSGVGPGRCSRTAALSAELWDCLDDILAKACAFDPRNRFRDGGELREALPETMMVSAAGSRRTEATRSENTLSASEVTALVAVIAQCPAESDWIAVGALRSDTGLSPYRFSLALRRLVELELLETAEHSHDYDRYTVFRPTVLGVRWAQTHPAEVDAVAPHPGEPSDFATDEIRF